MKKLILFLGVILNAHMGNGQTLTGTKWILTGIYNVESKENRLKDTLMKAMLYFDSDTTYTGAFCNRYFGKCNVGKDKSLTMSRPTASRRICDRYSELEGKLFVQYQNSTHYDIKDDKLYLFTGDKSFLCFRKE